MKTSDFLKRTFFVKAITIIFIVGIAGESLKAQTNYNLDFEDWNYNYYNYFPVSWYGSGISRDSNSISGNYAISLVGQYGCGFMPGQICYGEYGHRGLPISWKPTQLTGYYNYDGEDSSIVKLLLRKYDSVNKIRDTIGSGITYLNKTLCTERNFCYGKFTLDIIDLEPTMIPDTIEIFISAGRIKLDDPINDSTFNFNLPVLLLDNLKLFPFYQPTSINDNPPNEPSVQLFPNPLSDVARLKITNIEQGANYSIMFYDLQGRMVFQSEINNSQTEIKRGNLQAGMYFYKIFMGNESISNGKIIFQ